MDNRAIVRGDAVEIAVRYGDHRFARHALFRKRLIRRRIGRKIIGIEYISAAGPIETRVSFTCDHPFRFGDFPVIDFQAKGHNGRCAAFFDEAEISALSADRIEITPLNLSQAGSRLP